MRKIIVWCNGEDTHPKVYLKIPEGETKIMCPYCNKVFKKENEEKVDWSELDAYDG